MYAYQAAAEREAAANVKMPTAFEGRALLEGAWGCDDGGGRATAMTPMLTGEEEILGESLCVCDLWRTSLCEQQTLLSLLNSGSVVRPQDGYNPEILSHLS